MSVSESHNCMLGYTATCFAVAIKLIAAHVRPLLFDYQHQHEHHYKCK